jgi:hypothetical protein
MSHLSNGGPGLKSDLTLSSTLDWRRWWCEEAVCTGSDWQSLLDAASAVLHRLRAAHLSGASS